MTAVAFDAVQTRKGGRSARVRSAVLAAARDELAANGYAKLSHLAVARRAGVDPATVYRRWSTRARLAIDAVVDIAETAVPLPDTGSLRGDLTALHRSVATVLSDARSLRLFEAFSSAAVEGDPDVIQALQCFWEARFAAAGTLVDRAVQRGEIEPVDDPQSLIEELMAPIYLRALVTRRPIDAALTARSVEHILSLAGAGQKRVGAHRAGARARPTATGRRGATASRRPTKDDA
jgi:AcrR family transcriptional regulator